jgi:hypothetical protein
MVGTCQLFPPQRFDFTKLGSTGNVLNIQNATWRAGGTGTEDAGTKWSCVKDNHTGLIWEVKTDSGEKKHANVLIFLHLCRWHCYLMDNLHPELYLCH